MKAEDAKDKAFGAWGGKEECNSYRHSHKLEGIGRASEIARFEPFGVYRTNWQEENPSSRSGGAAIGGIVTQLIETTQDQLDKELHRHHETVKELSDRLQLFQTIQNQLGQTQEE